MVSATLSTSQKITVFTHRPGNRLHGDEGPNPRHTVRQGEERIGMHLFRILVHSTALFKAKPHPRSSAPLLKVG